MIDDGPDHPGIVNDGRPGPWRVDPVTCDLHLPSLADQWREQIATNVATLLHQLDRRPFGAMAPLADSIAADLRRCAATLGRHDRDRHAEPLDDHVELDPIGFEIDPAAMVDFERARLIEAIV